MNTIKLLTKATTNPGSYHVLWTITDGKTAGIVQVNVETKTGDPKAVAELAALRHLLVKAHVFVGRESPRNTKIHFSVDTAYEAALDVRTRGHAGFARFLHIRYPVSKAVLDNQHRWTRKAVAKELIEITVNEAEKERIYSPVIGSIEVTVHAMEKIMRHYPDAKNPYKTLTALLGTRNMERVEVTGKLKKAKQAKYLGKGGEGVMYRDPINEMVYQLSADGNVLVTAFKRKERYMTKCRRMAVEPRARIQYA